MADVFEVPAFMEGYEVDEIHERMLKHLPDDLDVSEGSYPWDFTRPTAVELSRFTQYNMLEAIQMIWPMFSSGIYLDYHGKIRNLARKEGIAAHGDLEITGAAGTVIKKGDLFSTESVNDIQSVSYAADNDATIPESGEVTITVTCIENGIIGNAAANTIILKETENENIESVTNPNPFTNGINPEEDDDYRARLVEFDQTQEYSYVGSISDYKRWANEVNGVGSVDVIPAEDTSGLVTIVVIDGNGNPASEEICTAVYNHIMRPDNPTQRLPPPQAKLSVVSPTTQDITISATVQLDITNIETVKTDFMVAVKEYFIDAVNEKKIKYSKITEILGSISGVYDYKDVTVNGGTSNITLTLNQLPVISDSTVTLTEGTV